jgi:hypothetical protein
MDSTFSTILKRNWTRQEVGGDPMLNSAGRSRRRCHGAGEDAMEVYNTFVFAEGEENKIETLIKTFELYCTPKKNVTFERHVFNTRNQEPSESIDSYVTELRKLAKSCEFAQLHDSLIKDRIVCGIHSAEFRQRI